MLSGFWPELDLDFGDVGIDATYVPKIAFGMALREQLDDVEKSAARVPVAACST